MRNWKSGCLRVPVVLFMTLPLFVFGQSKDVTIRLVNGKSGKPMEHERLLVFFGSSPQDVRFHKGSIDLHTDSKGEATLPSNESTFLYFQAFVDLRTLCQKNPNDRSFAVADILRDGEQTPNTCGKVAIPKTPGTFVIYARPATLREKMAW
jgi:hypothetical protein